MSDLIVCSGEWLERAEGHWRDQIDLSTCDSTLAYAAGARDGYDLAVRELRAFAELALELAEVAP